MSEDVINLIEYKIKEGEISPIRLPEPTLDEPYAEVKYVFNWMASLYVKKSSAENYSEVGLKHYIRYLNSTNDYKSDSESRLFSLNERWDEYCLVRFKSWFDDTNVKGGDDYISSLTASGLFSAIRKTIRMIKREGLAANRELIDVYIGAGGRETNSYKAFTEEEYQLIVDAVIKTSRFSERVAAGYKMTGYGVDPRHVENGWACQDNMRWYFENEMGGVAIPNNKEMKEKGLHQRFFDRATNYHGGLNKLYSIWGVERMITPKLLTPLLLRLAIETGLNAESLISLTRDCFIEKHPLTGMPSLRYWKTRGKGGQELHLALLGDPNVSDIQLKLKQARIVQKTIQLILKITDPLVGRVDENSKNDLFLFESESTRTFGKVSSLKESTKLHHKWLQRFSATNELKTKDGNKISVNLARFRPTLFTRLVNLGVDVLVVKDIAFHSSIITTLHYLETHNISKKAEEEVFKALNRVFQSARSEESLLPYATEESSTKGDAVKFKGLVCDCKNVFNPPAKVRKLKDYKEGSPCHYFNMCLECENILVTKESLPRLAAYRLSLLASIESQYQSPNKDKMMKYLMILDSIFDIESSEFDEEDIKWAMELAQFDNGIYDSQTATGIA